MTCVSLAISGVADAWHDLCRHVPAPGGGCDADLVLVPWAPSHDRDFGAALVTARCSPSGLVYYCLMWGPGKAQEPDDYQTGAQECDRTLAVLALDLLGSLDYQMKPALDSLLPHYTHHHGHIEDRLSRPEWPNFQERVHHNTDPGLVGNQERHWWERTLS